MLTATPLRWADASEIGAKSGDVSGVSPRPRTAAPRTGTGRACVRCIEVGSTLREWRQM